MCRGLIESVTYMPANQVAAFSTIVRDYYAPRHNDAAETESGVRGSDRGRFVSGRRDRLRVIWLGRRRVPGIEAGIELRLEGMLSSKDGLPTMFNPRYEILSRQEKP